MASFHPPLFNWKSSLVIEEVFSKNIIFSGHEKKYIGVYHPKWIVLLLHADWLVGKWIANNIHLQATNEAKLCFKSLISNHFLVHWKKQTHLLLSVWYILKQLFTSVLVKVVDIYLAASGLGKYPLLSTSTLMNNCLLWSCEADLVLRLQALLILVKICPSVSNIFCNVRLFIQIIFCMVYSHTGSSQCHGFDS